MRVLLALAVTLLAMPTLAGEGPADLEALAGVYKHRFQNGTVQGDKYESENILEIVPSSPHLAYFRAKLAFFNGHQCDIAGFADWDGAALRYREVDKAGATACSLSISVKDGGLEMQDGEAAACRDLYCGARGAFTGQRFALTEKRRIRYLDRLLASREYAEARSAYERLEKPAARAADRTSP